MRNSLFCLNEPLGNGRAHAAERHFLVGDAVIERLDLGGAGAGSSNGSNAAATAFSMVAGNDGDPRGPEPATRDRSMPRIGRQTAGQRRDVGATCEFGRSEIASGANELPAKGPS